MVAQMATGAKVALIRRPGTRGGPRLRTRPSIPLAERQALRSRMRGLGVRYEEVCAGLGISVATLSALLVGRQKSYSVLGYDRWPQYITEYLDGYEKALAILRGHLEAAQSEIDAQQLPRPRVLATVLPTARRRRRAVTASLSASPAASPAASPTATSTTTTATSSIGVSATPTEEALDVSLA